MKRMVSSLNMVLDGDELLELPYIGERLKKSSAAAPSARGVFVGILEIMRSCTGLVTPHQHFVL